MAKTTPVVWTRPALDSLLEIVRHIQADNPAAAQRFAQQIKTKASRLEAFPDSGRIVPEFPSSGLRELIAGDYRIICHVAKRPARVEILTIRHGARLLDEPSEWS